MPRGRGGKGKAPKINRNDPSRPVFREAERILQEVRGRALYLIPFRLMRHLPDHDALIRPVDTVRVTFIGKGMGQSGFRRHEPCCCNDPMPEIGLRRFVIGGNHRCASTRDSGQVLVRTNRVSRKQIQSLMRILKAEDALLVQAGVLDSHYKDLDQILRCLEILAVTLQGLEPAAKPLTCLQQVQLIRIAAKNDPMLDFVSSGTISYGGVAGLRARIFPGHPGTDDSSAHFLLNNKMGPRHKNKLLAGSKVLISTESSFSVPAISERTTILDILVYWESKGQIDTFLDTHLSYIGPMPAAVLHSIMEATRDAIESGNYLTTPFNTSAFRLHVGGTTGKRKATCSPKKATNSTKKQKSGPAAQKSKKSNGGDKQNNQENDANLEATSQTVQMIKNTSADSEKESVAPVSKTNATDASKDSPPEVQSASLNIDGAKGEAEADTAKKLVGTADLQLEKPEVTAPKTTELQDSKQKEIYALRKSLEEQRNHIKEEVHAAVEKERSAMAEKHKLELKICVRKRI